MAKWPYNTTRWKRLRSLKLSQNPLCEYCPPDLERPSTQVDHRKAIADGGDPWDMKNLASCCQSCHSQKTSHGEFLPGCQENGLPRDINHEWRK
jgi:5-methylcytosine-specific restriction protein A